MSELVNIKEACKILGVKESWIRSAIFKKKIAVVKLNRLVRFRKSDLEDYINKNVKSESQGDF
jgi:excisionase family DNA binding protein